MYYYYYANNQAMLCMLYLGVAAYLQDGFLGGHFNTNVEIRSETSLRPGFGHWAWFSDVRRNGT